MGKARPIKGNLSSLGDPPRLPRELFNNSTNFEAMSGNELADIYVKHGFQEYIKKVVKANFNYAKAMTTTGMTKQQIEALIDKTFSINLKTLRTGQSVASQIAGETGVNFNSYDNKKNTTPEEKEAYRYYNRTSNIKASTIDPIVTELLKILSADEVWEYPEQYLIYCVMTKISGSKGIRWSKPQLPDGRSTSGTRRLPPIEGEEAILAGTGGLKRGEVLEQFYMGLSFPVLKQNFMVLQSDGILKELCKSEFEKRDKSKTTAKQVEKFGLSPPPFEETWQMFLGRLGGLTVHQVLQDWVKKNNSLLDRLVDPRPDAQGKVDPTTIRDMIAGDVDSVGDYKKEAGGNLAARYLRIYNNAFDGFFGIMNRAVSKLVTDGIWGIRESRFISAIGDKLSRLTHPEKSSAANVAKSPEKRAEIKAKMGAAHKARFAAMSPEERAAWREKLKAVWAARKAKKRGDDEINEMGGKSRMRRVIRVRILKESASRDPLDTKFLSVQSISDYLTDQLGRVPTPNEILETYEKHLRALRDFGYDISEVQIAERMREAYKQIFLVKKARSADGDED